MKKYFPFIVILFFSCAKDVAIPKGKDFGGTVMPVVPFVPLTAGSFWIYDYYHLDTNKIETYINRDTIRIIKDSIINGKTYAVFHGSCEYKCSNCMTLRRDSSGYLVNEKGFVYFSATNFADTLENLSDSTGLFFFKMTHKDSAISVPAGAFQTYDYERILHYYWDSRPPQHCHYFYANGVGIVKSQWKYYNSSNYWLAKLVNYYIAP
ncbi:MAG: hypothetical protein HY063_12765 [Bacteroidetes bacterium]|nr:hypothetical protein [Bacteroidota bacterium]